MRVLILYLRAALTAIASCILLLHPATYARASVCHATPAQAMGSPSATQTKIATESRGYRLDTVRWDPLLEQRWAIVSSCDRPDLPPLILPIRKTAPGGNGSKPLFPAIIHAGDIVRILRQEEYLRMELTGIADESGPLGAKVRVRLLRPPAQSIFDTATRPMLAVVRGPYEVEVEP